MRILPDWAGYCQFRSAFADVMDERYHSLDWLDQQVLSGEFKFFRTEDAAIVVELRDYPTGARDVHGLIAAGNLADIVERLIPAAEAWGKEQGCIGAIIESRPGWAKALSQYGYEPHQLAVRKEL
ncbi:hypothetical protein SH584_11505 [Sphingomonas sp. LY29]|uniref:hypothetical protein n=1 Tax=Sphingomonas sp. LY29 TaxID=3095341 RepID=UPI002D7653C5|nr:hypothetical protein [Sphingomonas sp. LY29]WRP25658.1 hypothetical protein SH584_11505 [Sphingomonas sp. LY29]